MEINEIETFIIQAKNAGIPKQQLENFLRAKYVPLPWQLRFHSIARQADLDGGPIRIGAGGARGPGKSKAVFNQITLDDCQRISNLKCLFLRQTGKSAKESFEDLITGSLQGRVEHRYNRSENILSFNNGSKVLLGGFETASDIDKYVGIEYDLIAIEELNQLTEDKIIKLEGSLRTSKPNWRPRFYSSFNPGGIGHNWIKEIFVIPFREKIEIKTRFIGATYRDNPFLNKE